MNILLTGLLGFSMLNNGIGNIITATPPVYENAIEFLDEDEQKEVLEYYNGDLEKANAYASRLIDELERIER